jgi:PIN domain nuclease of toxin-antitoxin system
MPLPPLALYLDFLEKLAIREAPLTPAILVASSFLPGDYARDPWDRIMIATARETGARILTCDRAVLAYSAAGHVKTVAY